MTREESLNWFGKEVNSFLNIFYSLQAESMGGEPTDSEGWMH